MVILLWMIAYAWTKWHSTDDILNAFPKRKKMYVLIEISLKGATSYCKVVHMINFLYRMINTFRPRQNCRHFTDDIFKCIFLNEKVWIWLKISLKFVPKVRINNTPALVQIMAWCLPGQIMVWHRAGNKPLSQPMMVTRSQWVEVARGE